MDLSGNSPANNAAVKGGGEAAAAQESETPAARAPPAVKPLSFSSNGVLKRLNSLQRHHHAVVVVYKECLKNHAAAIGGHAVDGCGEFMPSSAATAADPTSLKCAACGCHRNFHRREPEELNPSPPPLPPPPANFQPHHRHHPPPPLEDSPNSPSPPPISSSYYPSAPHMLLALSNPTPNLKSRKRFRTKFTQFQKDKMLEFSEKIGWKIQKRDEDLINDFCREIGVERAVLKVWMHNNKNTVGKKDNNNNNVSSATNGNSHNLNFDIAADPEFNLRQESNNGGQNHYSDVLGANGSSSSS